MLLLPYDVHDPYGDLPQHDLDLYLAICLDHGDLLIFPYHGAFLYLCHVTFLSLCHVTFLSLCHVTFLSLYYVTFLSLYHVIGLCDRPELSLFPYLLTILCGDLLICHDYDLLISHDLPYFWTLAQHLHPKKYFKGEPLSFIFSHFVRSGDPGHLTNLLSIRDPATFVSDAALCHCRPLMPTEI